MLKATGRVANTFNDEICCASAMRNCWPRSRHRFFFSLSLFLSFSFSLPSDPSSPRLAFRYASVAASLVHPVCLPRFHFRRKCCSVTGHFPRDFPSDERGLLPGTFLFNFDFNVDHLDAREVIGSLFFEMFELLTLLNVRAEWQSKPEDRNRSVIRVTFSPAGKFIFIQLFHSTEIVSNSNLVLIIVFVTSLSI